MTTRTHVRSGRDRTGTVWPEWSSKATVVHFVLVLLLPALLGLSSSSHVAAAASNGPSAWTTHQKKIHQAWNSVTTDFPTFRSLFSDTANIKMCLKGMPFCTEGSFDEMLGGFEVTFNKFTASHKFLTGWAHPDTIAVEWVHYVNVADTTAGEGGKCADGTMWWGYGTYEFNQQGKVQRYVGMSEESEEVLACVSQVDNIRAEL